MNPTLWGFILWRVRQQWIFMFLFIFINLLDFFSLVSLYDPPGPSLDSSKLGHKKSLWPKYYPQLMILDEGWNIAQLVNWRKWFWLRLHNHDPVQIRPRIGRANVFFFVFCFRERTVKIKAGEWIMLQKPVCSIKLNYLTVQNWKCDALRWRADMCDSLKDNRADNSNLVLH